MRLALLQFDTIASSPAVNRATIERLMEGVECDLVVLPEMFPTGYSTDADAIAEPADGATLAWMKRWAAEHDAAMAGTVAVKEGRICYNRFYFVTPAGDCFHYDKRHLFTFAGEEKTFAPGTERIVVEWRGLRFLPLVCYDLRFPVWSYLPGEVDVVLYSAAWPAGRIGAWDTLLPARAIENQCWVVGVNRTGCDLHGTHHSGHSAAYDHLGHLVAECGEEPERVVVVEVNAAKIATFRGRFPAWRDADKFEFVETKKQSL